ncbi:MAG: VWA domain-containing protein [Candidatus Poribacteria bacterium]|nr:VWA domain-containing protein [Candidatus Poribacteria bacterium]
MLFEIYSEQLQRKRKKIQRAFLLSVVLHVIAVALVSISYVTWYRPMLSPETLVKDAISLTTVKRLHMSSERKRSMPKRRPTSTNAVKVSKQTAAQPMNSSSPIRTGTSMEEFGTDTGLPIAETSLSANATDSPEWKSIAVRNAQSPTITPITERIQEDTGAIQQGMEDAPLPVDRDGMMGEALEGIAESVADSETDSIVDIVFLLDISGSMIDNIRAVGRQLSQMATVFEEKGIDFRLGIVIFRYLEGDTIIHQPTWDVERYKRLLTTHVVAAAGDERAHNAIIKAIRRVKFRDEADRRFVLVTDEASKGSYTLLDILRQCQQNRITVDVIGINHMTHRALTTKTGGLWYPIPIQE